MRGLIVPLSRRAKLSVEATDKLIELQELFEAADADGSGTLEPEELAVLVQQTSALATGEPSLPLEEGKVSQTPPRHRNP